MRGLRSILNATFWMSYTLSGANPGPYHTVNVVLHALSSTMLLVVLRRIWQLAGGKGEAAPLIAATLFLVHPLQTESVAYVSSRSETLSILFAYAALAVQLTADPKVRLSGRRVVAMLLLLACGVLTKEHTAATFAIFVLNDYYWRSPFRFEAIRQNKVFYTLSILAGLGLAGYVLRGLVGADSAGFGVKGTSALSYLFTQFRMFWRYLRLALLPIGQNLDPDIPISKSLLEPITAVSFAGIMLLVAAAVVWRKRAPLASFGLLTFVIYLLPTSSIVPLLDVFAEHRLYLPFLGLCCIVLEGMRRWQIPIWAATVVLAVLSYTTWQRNHVWASDIALWADSVEGSPAKYRPQFQLAFAHYQAGHCAEATVQFEKAKTLWAKPDAGLLVDWALALDCAGNLPSALEKMREAAKLGNNAHVQAMIGLLLAKSNRFDEALAALDEAQKMDAGFASTYLYRGGIYSTQGKRDEAAAQFRLALQFEPGNLQAQQGLAAVTRVR
jgi:tetratricopeptide (TPR) repeat protein